MAYHPSPPRHAVTSSQAVASSILLLALDDELISLICSALLKATSLSPLAIRPDAIPSKAPSPTGTPSTRIPRLNVPSSALSSPDYVAQLIQSTNTTSILIDLRGHANELGLSCGILAALKRVGFAGHVIYVSVSGDLLKPTTESRALREAYPVHAAVEMQLQNTETSNVQNRFSWTVLGRSTQPVESPTPSPISPPAENPTQSTPSAQGCRGVGDIRGTESTYRSSSLSVDDVTRTPASELAEGIIRAIRNQSAAASGSKIMLDLVNGRRRSFMHQTDWTPD